MFKFVAFFAVIAVATAMPSFIGHTHTLVQPAILTKSAVIDNSASSAITHQSYTNLVHKVAIAPVVPIVKTVHAAPVVHTVAVSAPIIKTVAPVVPIVKTIHVAPVVHAAPVVHTYAAAPLVHAVPVVHSVPVLKTVVAAPVAYGFHH